MTAAAVLKLQRAGFTEEQVAALAEYFDEQLATKADLAAAEARLNSTLVQVRGEVDKARSELTADAARLETKIEQARSDTIKWVIGAAFAQAATILAVLRFFPGHP